jgi:hypothetical protein
MNYTNKTLQITKVDSISGWVIHTDNGHWWFQYWHRRKCQYQVLVNKAEHVVDMLYSLAKGANPTSWDGDNRDDGLSELLDMTNGGGTIQQGNLYRLIVGLVPDDEDWPEFDSVRIREIWETKLKDVPLLIGQYKDELCNAIITYRLKEGV